MNDNEEQLSQLSKKELVKLILNQQTLITELQTKIEKLILSRDLDSKNSSKPPSSDLLKKPEGNQKEKQLKKKKPGGQLGHPGTTRKGFGRVDRYELLKAETCSSCGQLLEGASPVKIEKQSVLKDTASHIAVLIERPIEIVEYQRYHLKCQCCGSTTTPAWSNQIGIF